MPLFPGFSSCHSSSESIGSSWVRTGCLDWEGVEILLLVRLHLFSLFLMIKVSLSCIPERLGICLLLNPRACVLGRRLGQEQNHEASIRGRLPGASVLRLGSKRKHSCLKHAVGGRCQHSCPAMGGRPERGPCGWEAAPSVQRRVEGKGSPRPVHASLGHISFRRVWLLLFQLSTLQSKLGKSKGVGGGRLWS